MSTNRSHVWQCGIQTAVSALAMLGFYIAGSTLGALMFVVPLVLGAFATGLWYASLVIEGDV